ncbi:MAG: hypothetical protein PHE97_04440 [Candidatus Omnitrophica bacterium]|nr:hypothetical protein [Candidatus Omnitrophota bacterium]
MIRFLFVVFLFLPLVSRAESIVFKSGASLNVPIVERTNKSIKVNVDGLLISYYSDEIETIDGLEVEKFFYSRKNSLEEVSQDDYIKLIEQDKAELSQWESWFREISGYMARIQDIGMEFQSKFMPLFQEIVKSGSTPAIDRSREDNLIKEAKKVADDFSLKMGKLIPPDEFKLYHQLAVRSVKRIKEAFGMILEGDIISGKMLYQQAKEDMIAQTQELKKIYQSHKAPQVLIDNIDKALISIGQNF